jgi:hypothetical protein
MSDNDLDRRLKEFLDACESERELGHTNAAIQGTLQRIVDNQAMHEKNDVERFAAHASRLDQHHWRIGSLEERATRHEAKQDKLAEDTGSHRVIVAERKAEGPMKVLLALMGAALTVCGALLVWALTRGH